MPIGNKDKGAGANKPNAKEAKKTPEIPANIAKKIKVLEEENLALKANFNVKEYIRMIPKSEVTEYDATAIANEMVKTAVTIADTQHSLEIQNLEKKHNEEMERLKQNLQGKDQPLIISTMKKPDESLIHEKNVITELKEEIASLQTRLKKHEELLVQRDNEIAVLNNGQTRMKQAEEVRREKNRNVDTTKEVTVQQMKVKEQEELVVQKENMITELNKEIASLQARLKEPEQLLVQKEKKITELNKEIESLQARINKPDESLTELKKGNKSLQTRVTEQDELLVEKEKIITELNTEIARLQARINKADESLTELKKENKSLQTRGTEQDKLLVQKEKIITELNTEIASLQERLKEHEKSLAEKDKEITDMQRKMSSLETRLNESKGPVPSNKSANEEKKLQQLKDENEKLKNRLSEMAGAQMTYNNPNIADLSDDFRPTKLSEDYSQIYDNQWTDAFEEHSDNTEEEVIAMLRKQLLDSYEFCDALCKTFTENLQNSTLALPNAKKKPHDVPLVYKKQLQDVKKSFGAFLRKDVTESYWKRNTLKSGEKTTKYVDACVEICWLMVIQEPPVFMESQASKDGTFDSETFKTYTKTGRKVDFVVWPALRLHKGGPLLTKGVAQGKN